MKIGKLPISVLLLLFLISIHNLVYGSETMNSVAMSSSSTSNYTVFEDLIERTPMTLGVDGDFVFYGCPGDGSPGNPYRIENYNITTTGQSCLTFQGYTTKHFIVQNCFLKTNMYDAILLGQYQEMAPGTVHIYNNTIISRNHTALTLNGSVEGKIVDNFVVGLDGGIDVKSDFTYIKGNIVYATTAIRLINSIGTEILNNICNENTEVGINLINSNDSVIIGNNCSKNGDTGIRTENSLNLTLSYNYLAENFYGMRILGSSDSSITNNYFESNNGYGLIMQGSVELNKIYHNAFITNNLAGSTIQASDDTGDQWYNEELLEGNYWDNWNPIVSNSYTIDGTAGSEDLYPLDEIPDISEYTTGFSIFFMIAFSISVAIVLYNKKR